MSSEETSRWERDFQYQNNDINLNVDVPLSALSDYDELIPIADGIVYILNPNSSVDLDLFKDIIKIISKARRNIPMIILFHDHSEMIKQTNNELLRWIWDQYPVDVFISDLFSPPKLQESLETIITSIIKSELLVNFDTAWMQIPYLMAKVNQLVEQNEFALAALNTDKLAKIFRKIGNQDWTIYAEQAAWLYSQVKDYLNAATMIKDFNKKHTIEFQQQYVESLIENGRELYNQKKYIEAAEAYQKAGNWARIELNDPEFMKNAYKLAIDSWVSGFETQNAFSLLERFDHDEIIDILEDLTEKIARAADILSNSGQLEYSKSMLYLTFLQYQKSGLFESITVLGNKAIKIIKQILEEQLKAGRVYAAKMSIDEIYNLWDTYDLDRENLDHFLVQLAQEFIKVRDFQKVEVLIPKIGSLKIQNKLTQQRMDEEQKIKDEVKKVEEIGLSSALIILSEFVKTESQEFHQMNKNLMEQSSRLISRRKIEYVASNIKNQAHWLQKIEHSDASNEILEYLFRQYLEHHLIIELSNDIFLITETERKQFLIGITQQIRDILKDISHNLKPGKYEEILEKVIHIYRTHLLYDQARLFSTNLVDHLIREACNIAAETTSGAITRAIDVIHKIENISAAYLDGAPVDLDPIHSIIVKHYYLKGEFQEARSFNEKINNKEISLIYYAMIETAEAEEMEKVSTAAQKRQTVQMAAEQLSQLKNLARDQKIAQENLLRLRTGLKRHYFQEALTYIDAKEFDKAGNVYFNSAIRLAQTNKFELAGLSAGLGALCYLSNNEITALTQDLDNLKSQLGLSHEILEKTFPLKLINFILQMMRMDQSQQLAAAFKLCENFALFPEEQPLMEKILGGDLDYSQIIAKLKGINPQESSADSTNFKILIDKIHFDPALRAKRNALERKHWQEIQNDFARQDYEQVFYKYLSTVDEMVVRSLPEFAEISIVMGFLALSKVKTAQESVREYEKFYFNYEKKLEFLTRSDLLKLLEIYLQYYSQRKSIVSIIEIVIAFREKLILLDWESAFIKSLLSHFKSLDSDEVTDISETIGTISSKGEIYDDSLLTQQIVVLTQLVSDSQEMLEEIKNKRIKTSRAYYSDIINDIEGRKYKEVSSRYQKLAKRMARRNDFDSAGLMLLLASLSLLKNQEDSGFVKSQLESLLSGMGHVKKILDETIGVKFARLLIDAIESQSIMIKKNLQQLLHQLPLLDSEAVLMNF